MAVQLIVPRLSRAACYRLGGFLGGLAARFDRRGMAVARANLQAAFPERGGEEVAAIARESYRHFARAMLDLFWGPRLTPENLADYIEFENVERLRAELGPEQSCILCGFHYSNFEWMSPATAYLGLPCAVTTQEFKNPLLDRFFTALRESPGHQNVPRQGALVKLFKILRKGGRAALLVDTTLPPHHPTVVIECFGMKTIITVAHAWLAERTGAPLIPIYSEPLADGRYRVVLLPAVKLPAKATHQEIAQACWDAFEPVVRRQPAPWMWMYKHWRYRPMQAARPYPFYASESHAFEQIAARPAYAKLDRTLLPQPAAR